MKRFKVILKWVKRQGTMPGIGEFKETMGQTLWWGTLVSFVMLSGTFYYTTLRFVLPWYDLPKFVTTMILGLVTIYIFEHKYGVKSLWEYHWKLMGGNVDAPKTKEDSVVDKDTKKTVVIDVIKKEGQVIIKINDTEVGRIDL